jgi:hypothetical protein
MEKKAYTEEEVNMATKIANAMIEGYSNAYVVHLQKKLAKLKAKNKR